MKKIKLTQGKYALVNDCYFEKLNRFKWYALKRGNTFYAVRSLNGKKIHMHRVILRTPSHKETDHIDGYGLNNQIRNLRECTHSENQRNKVKSKNNTSGYKGLSWCERNKKWLVRISVNSKRIYLGHFKTKKAAGEAYKVACIKYHGKFARI
jgi:hypothetical protein